MSRAVSILFACLAVLASIAAQDRRAKIPAKITVAWQVKLAAPSFGGAAVADIDGDGRLEIAFGTYFGDDSVRVLNGEDGSEYWRFNAGNACLDASLRFVDLDRDGTLELVVPISNLGWVLAFDAKTGDEKWRYSTKPIQCTDTPPAIVDFDGDGDLEVIYGTFKGKLHAISATGKRERVFHPVEHFVQSGPIVRDLDGDGVRDLVCTTFKGDNRVYAVNGKTGETLWKFQVPGKHMGMYHGPSIGDLDGDGSLELVVGAYDGKVYCLRAKDGKKLWVVDTKDRYIMSPTVIADLDGDGKSEVIVASQYTTVIDAKGKVAWSKPCARAGDSATRGVSVADLNGDGKLDLVSLSGGGLVRVFDGGNGTLHHEFDAAKLCKNPVVFSSHGVTIADLTGDGDLDVFFVVGGTRPKKHGLAVCLTGFAGSGRGWYMLRHDPENSGNLATKLDPTLLDAIEQLTPTKNPVGKPSRAPKILSKPGPRPKPARRAAAKWNMQRVFELAEQRGITREAVVAATEGGADLEEHGLDGFRAVCLLIETGNHRGIYCHPLIKRTYQPGFEKELLKLCARDSLPSYGLWAALHCLGYADTKEVRSYLLKRLKTERGAGLFMSIAQALGELGEERGIAMVGAQILRFEVLWTGVEPHLLAALSQMGATSALPFLVKYVQHEKATRFHIPLKHIAALDADKASELAEKVLADRTRLNSRQRATLKRFVK